MPAPWKLTYRSRVTVVRSCLVWLRHCCLLLRKAVVLKWCRIFCLPVFHFFFGSGHRSSKRYRSFGRGMLRSRCKGRHCEAVRKQKLSGLARGYGCRACFPNSPSAAVVLLEKYFCDNFEFPTCPERSVSKERKRRQKHTHKHSHKMGSVERPILMIRFICRKCCTNKFRLIPGLERTLPTIRGHSLGPGAAVCKAARAFVSP